MADDGQVLNGEMVQLRRAAEADIDDLARIRRAPEVYEHWRGGDDMVAAVREDLAEPGATSYVILLDGRVVGWVQWQAEEEPDYRHASMDIYVDPAVRGRGLGTDALTTLARHLVAEHGQHRIEIDPAATNAAAIRCYTKVGFRPVGILRRNERGVDGSWHDSLLMDLLADEVGVPAPDGPHQSECYCCGREFPPEQLARLLCYSDVALCGGCAGWLATRTKALLRAVPVLATPSLVDSASFWEAAGFTVERYSADFASAYSDGVELHLVESAPSGRDRGEAYLHVRDVDAVHAAWAAAGLPVTELRDEPWGMREFDLVDPGGNRVRVGRSL